MPISGLYISNRQVRIEVKGQRAPRPHSVAAPDMELTGTTSPSHVHAAPFQSRPHTPPSSWGSTPSSPSYRGGGVGETDGLDSLSLSPRTSHPPGHSRLPSTDSGIQADAGWDSLTRSYNKTFSKSGLTSPTVSSSPGNVRTINIEVLRPGEGGDKKVWGETLNTGSTGVRVTSVTSPDVNSGRPRSHTTSSVSSTRITSPVDKALGVNNVYSHTRNSDLGSSPTSVESIGSRVESLGSPRSRPGDYSSLERCLASPDRPGTARVMSSSFTSFSPSSSRVMSPDRKLGPLNLLSSSTPVIPSRTSHPAGGEEGPASPKSGDWVVGGRNNFPAHTRTTLAQAEFRTTQGRDVVSSEREGGIRGHSVSRREDVNAMGRGPTATPQDVYILPRSTNPTDSTSPTRLHQPVQSFEQSSPRHQPHQHGAHIVTQHYRPRVNPVPTRFITPRTQIQGGGLPLGFNPNVASVRAVGVTPPRTLISVPVSHVITGSSSQIPEKTVSGPVAASQSKASSSTQGISNPVSVGPHPKGLSGFTSQAVTKLSTQRVAGHGPQGHTGPSSQKVAAPGSQAVVMSTSQGITVPNSQKHSEPSSGGVKGPSFQSVTEPRSESSKEPNLHEITIPLPSSSTFPRSVKMPPTVTFPASRSKVSPILLRESMLGRLAAAQPSSGTVHHIPIRHVDSCSAVLKPSTSSSSSSSSLPNQTSISSTDIVLPTNRAGGSAAEGANAPSAAKPPAVVVTESPTKVTSTLTSNMTSNGEKGGDLSTLPGTDGEKIPIFDVPKDVPWTERRNRIDSALNWLRTELKSLRAMDTALMTQFRRCQDTIESLKQQQRDAALENELWWGADGSEFDEEEEAWEDWEIAEFERKWAENPDAKELEIKVIPASSASSSNTKDTATPEDMNITPPKDDQSATSLSREKNGAATPSPVKQDVEATV